MNPYGKSRNLFAHWLSGYLHFIIFLFIAISPGEMGGGKSKRLGYLIEVTFSESEGGTQFGANVEHANTVSQASLAFSKVEYKDVRGPLTAVPDSALDLKSQVRNPLSENEAANSTANKEAGSVQRGFNPSDPGNGVGAKFGFGDEGNGYGLGHGSGIGEGSRNCDGTDTPNWKITDWDAGLNGCFMIFHDWQGEVPPPAPDYFDWPPEKFLFKDSEGKWSNHSGTTYCAIDTEGCLKSVKSHYSRSSCSAYFDMAKTGINGWEKYDLSKPVKFKGKVILKLKGVVLKKFEFSGTCGLTAESSYEFREI